MYYSSGNYEAFAHPEKPEGVEHKSAYLIGSGLASLSAACFLVRDAKMPGSHIHIFEKNSISGGALDGDQITNVGYVMRGGREMDNHFECMWDLFRSIPSIETEGISILDEYYWLNKKDPNYSLCRATLEQGKDANTENKFGLSDKGAMEIMKLFMTSDEKLENVKMTELFDDEVFGTNFWMYWRTMFAFKDDQSALEMKRYMQRYIHHIGGLPDFTALRFTKYNQYESMVLPMIQYLQDHDVQFHYNTQVMNVIFDIGPETKTAKTIVIQYDGQAENIDFPKIRKRDTKNWIKKVAENFDKKIGDINYLFCNDEKILEVNNQYLSHDFYTDIITFDYSEGNKISGDIFISLDTVRSNSQKFNTDFLEELYRVIIHGILHLCGVNDKSDKEEKQMRLAENDTLKLLNMPK